MKLESVSLYWIVGSELLLFKSGIIVTVWYPQFSLLNEEYSLYRIN